MVIACFECIRFTSQSQELMRRSGSEIFFCLYVCVPCISIVPLDWKFQWSNHPNHQKLLAIKGKSHDSFNRDDRKQLNRWRNTTRYRPVPPLCIISLNRTYFVLNFVCVNPGNKARLRFRRVILATVVNMYGNTVNMKCRIFREWSAMEIRTGISMLNINYDWLDRFVTSVLFPEKVVCPVKKFRLPRASFTAFWPMSSIIFGF